MADLLLEEVGLIEWLIDFHELHEVFQGALVEVFQPS